MSNYDPFKPDSGLKDDYDGTIHVAEFQQSQRGTWNLHLTVEADDGESTTIVLGLFGSDWQSVDGGETIEGRKFFDQRGKYSKFLVAAMACGGEKELRKRSDDLYGGRGPMHAGLWVGLRFHFDVIEEAGNVLEGDKWVSGKVSVVRPTKYLGTTNGKVESAVQESFGTPKTENQAGPTPTNRASNGAVPGIHPTDLAMMTNLAQLNDFNEWVDAVMTTRGADGEHLLKNPAVKAMLSSQEQYEKLKG